MVHELAGKRAPSSALANIPRLVSAYYTHRPDVSDPTQQVSFGTSGHRGSSLRNSFNEAHVLAIDKQDRILTLLGPKKNVVDIEVGEEARNFDQIRVGDQLRIEYYESVALYLGKPGTQPEKDAGLVVARSPARSINRCRLSRP